jgi:hypothetical protein
MVVWCYEQRVGITCKLCTTLISHWTITCFIHSCTNKKERSSSNWGIEWVQKSSQIFSRRWNFWSSLLFGRWIYLLKDQVMVFAYADASVVTSYCANIHMEYKYNKKMFLPFRWPRNPLKHLNQDMDLLLNMYY